MEYQDREGVRTEEAHEQAVARGEQYAAQGNAGAAHPVAQGTSNPLRLPGSSEEFATLHQAQEIEK
jgi:hypothetical protein